MIRVLVLASLFFSFGVYPSQKLGLKDVSIVSLDGQLVLQVNHLFLGVGEKQAYITLQGCNDGIRTFKIQNEFYSEFELKKCALDIAGDKYVELFHGKLDFSNKYSRYYFSNESKIRRSSVSQYDNYLSAELRFHNQVRDGFLVIHISDENGFCSVKRVQFSLINGSTLYYNRWLSKGSIIKEFVVNDAKLNIERE